MNAVKKYRSPAKNKVIDMLIELKDVQEGEYTFSLHGDKTFAEDFVHRMRVELSRLRKQNEKRGKTNRPFKILLVSLTELPNGEIKVVLKKSMQGHQVFDGVAEIFDLLGSGEKING